MAALEFTFFVDAERYDSAGAELAASWEDLVDAGVEHVDVPVGYGRDLADRVPVRVRATPGGLRFYARLLGVDDPLQLDELSRIVEQGGGIR
ncbi:MAG: hypothetical protein AAFZ07_09050 [Actinomycetota bacterium]